MSNRTKALFILSVALTLIVARARSSVAAQVEKPTGSTVVLDTQSPDAAETDLRPDAPAIFPIMDCGVTYTSDIASVGDRRYWTIEPVPGRPLTVIAITEPYKPNLSNVDTVLKLWSTVGTQVAFHTMNDDMDGYDSWLHHTPAYNNPASPTGARYDVELYDFNQAGTGRVDLYWDYVTYFSMRGKGKVQRLSYTPGDILAYDYCRNRFRMVFDASDVGYSGTANLTDMALVNRWTGSSTFGAILMTFANSNDVVAFYPANLGSTTQGSKEVTFDGSDVGLTTTGERLDGLAVDLDGNLILGTKSPATVPGLSFAAEDLVRFIPGSFGSATTGTYSWRFDGSDVNLNPRIVQLLGTAYGIDHAYHNLTGNWYPQYYMTFDSQVDLFGGPNIPPDRIAICRLITPAPNTMCDWRLDDYFPGIPGSDPIVDGIDKGNWLPPFWLPPLSAGGETNELTLK